jgi:methylglutaconyl-CoA hydratase
VSAGIRTTLADDGVLQVVLDRPEKRNALSGEMIGELADAMARAEVDAGVRAVMVRGEGTDFCAGADLAELLASAGRPMDENERDALRLGEVFLAMRRIPKPVVAWVRGRALAGGCGLATACDLVVAARSARFGYPEIERGFVPAMVMTMLRRSVGEKRAFDLIGTGRVVDADEALAMGLVSRVVDDAAFEAEASWVMQALASRPAAAMALTKQLFTDLDGREFGDGILLGARVNALSRTTGDFKRAVQAFLDA